MVKFHRIVSILLLLALTACGAVVTVRIQLPDAPPTATASPSPTITNTARPTNTATARPTNTTTPTATASPTVTQGAPSVTTLVNLNLRNGACATCAVLTVIPANRDVQLYGRSSDSAWLNVQHGTFRGWVSSNASFVRINNATLGNLPIVGQATATPTVQPTEDDPTPTREVMSRIGYNINGEAVPNMTYLLEVMTSPCKTHSLVMNNLSLAVRIKELCPETYMVSRNYSACEGDEWVCRSPQSFVNQWIAEGHREIIRHSTNEPSFGRGRRLEEFVAKEIELMKLARANGFTLAMGNFSVGIYEPEDINAGLFDHYIRALNQYGHYLALHEYAVAVLPFGVGQWQTSALLDRTRVQPASWPRVSELPTRLINGQLPGYWYLRRGDWWLLRADAIGVPRPRILVTEFGWDNLPNIKPAIEPLRSQFGIDRYFDDMRGVNTYQRLWPHYWPNWSFARAACEQLLWADSVYPSEYIGFALFTWSTNPHWLQTDFSGQENGAMYELHDCLAAA
jgi:uncharacterized protein YraI